MPAHRQNPLFLMRVPKDETNKVLHTLLAQQSNFKLVRLTASVSPNSLTLEWRLPAEARTGQQGTKPFAFVVEEHHDVLHCNPLLPILGDQWHEMAIEEKLVCASVGLPTKSGDIDWVVCESVQSALQRLANTPAYAHFKIHSEKPFSNVASTLQLVYMMMKVKYEQD